jgi:hypothetical protein
MRKLLILSWLFFLSLPIQAEEIGQTLQINTRLSSVTGHPTWLLIIRDVNTGIVRPYIYDIIDNDNFWIAFSGGHSYRITASTLKFGPFAIIQNFCGLQNGILDRKSMILTLTGRLTPYRGSSKCTVIKYRGNSFPNVNQ